MCLFATDEMPHPTDRPAIQAMLIYEERHERINIQ